MQENLEDQFVQEALNKGLDLRKYSKEVERDLHMLEKKSIKDCKNSFNLMCYLFFCMDSTILNSFNFSLSLKIAYLVIFNQIISNKLFIERAKNQEFRITIQFRD